MKMRVQITRKYSDILLYNWCQLKITYTFGKYMFVKSQRTIINLLQVIKNLLNEMIIIFFHAYNN